MCLVSSAAISQPARTGAVPNPKVTGPIPATVQPGDPSHDYPFLTPILDLPSHGYVEEEFFLEGTANRYNTPPLATGSILDSGHPYRTRMVVHRPMSEDQFNGSVVMELQTIGPDYEHDAFWQQSHDHLMRRGYAWVGVSGLRIGVHKSVTGLKAWSPTRYGSLDITDNGTVMDDGLSYDIVSQAAQAIRSPQGVDPMGGLRVERVLAAGGVAAANRLALYHNSIHPLAGLIDAFLLAAGGGQLRTDLDVKVVKFLTETDVSQGALREPDSDHFRRYELTGTGRIDYYFSRQLLSLFNRDNVPPQVRDDCQYPSSRIPARFGVDAALDHAVRWVRDNVQPPTGSEIQLLALGPPVVIARDSSGIALGGIRLPQVAVPTAVNTGVNTGPGFCPAGGSFQPFDNVTLRLLYPDQMTYVIQVIQATLDSVKAGFLVPEDAAETITESVYSSIGRQ